MTEDIQLTCAQTYNILFIVCLLTRVMLCLELIVHITYVMNGFLCSGWKLVGAYSRWFECPLKRRSKLHLKFPFLSPCDTCFQFSRKMEAMPTISDILKLLQMIVIWHHHLTWVLRFAVFLASSYLTKCIWSSFS